MRERFTRRCAAHRTALFERAEGYRLEEQSRESGLWCSTSLPGTTSGHWASRWIVWDDEAPEGEELIGLCGAEPNTAGVFTHLDEDFFSPWFAVLDHLETLPKRTKARREQARSETHVVELYDELMVVSGPREEPPPENGLGMALRFMAMRKPAEQLVLDWFAEGTA